MSDFNQIINNADIVSTISNFVNLQKKGKDYVGLCPFHGDSNPSMSVSPDKKIFKCFSCGVSGNALTFLMKIKSLSFTEAIKILASEQGIELNIKDHSFDYLNQISDEQKELLDILSNAESFFHVNLLANNNAKKYLESRNISLELARYLRIGYAPEDGIARLISQFNYADTKLNRAGLKNENLNEYFRNRLIFPIHDEHGNTIAFSGRLLYNDKNSPKYLNSPETIVFNKSSVLYNFDRAKEEARIKKEIYLCEGFFDVIALLKVNYKNAVALMGTALTKQHLNLLRNLRINIFLDNDTAGVNATLHSVYFLLKNKFEVFVINNPFDLDPDEILVRNGSNALLGILNNKITGIEHVYNLLIKRFNLDEPKSITLLNIKNFIEEFKNYLVYCDDEIINYFRNKIHNKFNYEFEVKKNEQSDEFYELNNDEKLIDNSKIFNQTYKQNNSYNFNNKTQVKRFNKAKIKNHLSSDPLNILLISFLKNPSTEKYIWEKGMKIINEYARFLKDSISYELFIEYCKEYKRSNGEISEIQKEKILHLIYSKFYDFIISHINSEDISKNILNNLIIDIDKRVNEFQNLEEFRNFIKNTYDNINSDQFLVHKYISAEIPEFKKDILIKNMEVKKGKKKE